MHCHTVVGHIAWQLAVGLTDPVLRVDRGNVRVCSDSEGNVERIVAAVVTGRLHVDHVVDAVDLPFDRRGNSFFQHFGIGAGIGRRNVYDRRGDIRKLLNRKRQIPKHTGNSDNNGNDQREFRPVDKKA